MLSVKIGGAWLLAAACAMGGTTDASAQTDARIVPVAHESVSAGGAFWRSRMNAVREGTLGANRHQCDVTGRIANFERAAAKIAGDPNPGAYQGLLFNDSDVYKMMEGWAYLIAAEEDAGRRAALDADLDALIEKVARAQHADGYINTYYTLKAGVENRFTREEWDHETYCMGHLIEAGVAHYQATKKRTLLDVAIRAADFLDDLYGPETFTAPPGHQELELALVRLFDVTGQTRYLDLAEFLLEQRGRPHRKLDGTMYGPWGDYAQDHKPVAEQMEAAGHAVRAGYMYMAMADLALRGRGNYRGALDALWEDVTERRMFITGGIGPSAHNEGFTDPYDIPTHSAYQETCASIALCMWAHRMFLLTGEARYMDQFERTLYNAVLAGLSGDGARFFYVNPMASRGSAARRDWFECACCPPNVLRFLASLGRYTYAVRGDTIYVNQYMPGVATVEIGGERVTIEQETGYPFDGAVRIRINNTTSRELIVAARWPSWAPRGGDGPKIDADGYLRTASDPGVVHTVGIRIPMEARRVYADPRVKESVGRVAIMRGPIVYAAESPDHARSVHTLVLPPGAALGLGERGVLGAPSIVASALSASSRGGDGSLYRDGPVLEEASLSMIPYFAWANRGKSEMVVWLPESVQFMDPLPPSGVRASASFVGHGEGPGAIIDGLEPSSSIDHSIPRLTFWPRKGVAGQGGAGGSGPVAGDDAEPAGREWVAVEFDEPRRVGEVSVYWFDDTGRGQCRVPRGWSVEALVGGTWRRVASVEESGVVKDAFNTARFEPVSAKGVRVKIDMREGFSAGVLEMRVR
ncbi:MAG: glycoside hydrolase family 127 protein [Phycisphaeraceae bacterium]|nr:MAG: glycoside hydrolase family 127 protein [Phycisphaeraceae bacterium]